MKLSSSILKPALHIYARCKRIPGCLKLAILATAMFFVWAAIPSLLERYGSEASQERGAYGDQYGAFNALVSAFAFVGMLVALSLQRKELSEQRNEMVKMQEKMDADHLQRKELERKDRAMGLFEKWNDPDFLKRRTRTELAIYAATLGNHPLPCLQWLKSNPGHRSVSDFIPKPGTQNLLPQEVSTMLEIWRFFRTWCVLEERKSIDSKLLRLWMAGVDNEWRKLLLAPLREVEPNDQLRDLFGHVELTLFGDHYLPEEIGIARGVVNQRVAESAIKKVQVRMETHLGDWALRDMCLKFNYSFSTRNHKPDSFLMVGTAGDLGQPYEVLVVKPPPPTGPFYPRSAHLDL